MTPSWQREYWLKYETDAEHAERVQRVEREADDFFRGIPYDAELDDRVCRELMRDDQISLESYACADRMKAGVVMEAAE